jgi:hypothetical protein
MELSGADPWSARVPLDPLLDFIYFHNQTDEGVGRGPGGPPHFTFKGACHIRILE